MGAGRMGDEGCVPPSARVSTPEAFPTIEGTTLFFASPSVAYEKTRTPTRGGVASSARAAPVPTRRVARRETPHVDASFRVNPTDALPSARR